MMLQSTASAPHQQPLAGSLLIPMRMLQVGVQSHTLAQLFPSLHQTAFQKQGLLLSGFQPGIDDRV
jgi:hypothetical protein